MKILARLTVVVGLFVLLSGCVSCPFLQTTNTACSNVKPIGVISALPFETAFIKSQLQNTKIHKIFGREYYEGNIGKQKLVVAQVGVGIINASVGTALLIDKFSPSAIFLLGIAGGTNKTRPGDVILTTSSIYYDFGIHNKEGKLILLRSYTPTSTFTGEGVKQNPLYFKSDKELFAAAIKASKSKALKLNPLVYKDKKYQPEIIQGIISTTETFCDSIPLAEKIMKTTGAIAFEMEGAGVAQVCYHQKVPFMIIKAISDDGNFEMYKVLRKDAARNAELLLEATVKELNSN